MNREILLMVEALARGKSVPREVVFSALEAALVSAVRKRFAEEVDLRVQVDRDTGLYECFRRWKVVPDGELDDHDLEIILSEALKQKKEVVVGDFIEETVDSTDLGRIAASAAKQVILQKIRDAEREQILEDFLLRGGALFSGTVKRVDRDGAIIESGRVEARLPKDQSIPKENLRVGDRVRAHVLRVNREARGPQLILSRTSPDFVQHLFLNEVPEIEQGLMEIKAVARDPGVRAKIAVWSRDPRIDPIGTCVGVRGSRVQAVTGELAGERVDIVLWSEDPAQFVIGALAPANIQSIMVDEDKGCMDVVADQENLPLAIGAGGRNVRLASQLTGWQINIMSPEESQGRNEEERLRARELFIKKLDVEEEVADALIDAGFITLEQVVYVPVDEILEIEGFDEDIANELRARSRDVLLMEALATEEKMSEVSDDLVALPGMDRDLLLRLVEAGIRTRDDLADLSVSELVECSGVEAERAGALIIAARAHWFADAES